MDETYMGDKKNFFLVLAGYLIWGVQPLYWNYLGHMGPLFNLAWRILWAMVFTVAILGATKRLPAYFALFKDKGKMKYLLPATLFCLLDWGVFIYAVQAGHVLDVSLGYYMGPFVVFGISRLVFKEKFNKLVWVAMLLAVAGVLFNVVYNVLGAGEFPLLAIVLPFLFAIYGMFKRFAQVDSVVSIAVEATMMAPMALAFLLLSEANTVAGLHAVDHLLLMGAGIITALPMMLYSLGVLKLPFMTLGFMQYISPTLGLLCGLLLGEKLTVDRLITFLFIWAGLAVYMASILQEEKKRKAMQDSACGN